MKAAKFTRSDDICRCCARGAAVVVSILVASSGDPLYTQPATARAFVAERLVRYALLDVIGFAGKDHQ